MIASDHGMMKKNTTHKTDRHSDRVRFSQVGICLKYLPSAADQPDARYNGDTVPWQRVINSKGIISQRQVPLVMVMILHLRWNVQLTAPQEGRMEQLTKKPPCSQKECKLAVAL